MKKILEVLMCGVLFSWGMMGTSYAYDTEGCIGLSIERGTRCNSANSMEVSLQNNCGVTTFWKICVEEIGGKFNCFSDHHFTPNEKNSGGFACHATGQYKFEACTNANECYFESPK